MIYRIAVRSVSKKHEVYSLELEAPNETEALQRFIDKCLWISSEGRTESKPADRLT